MIYCEHVARESFNNFQLGPFALDVGHFESAAVATNMALDLPTLYAFICAGTPRKRPIAELKGELALDVVPTQHCGANTAWEQLSVLAHNLIRNFQLDTIATPEPRPRNAPIRT